MDWLHRAGARSFRIIPQRTELPRRFRRLRRHFDLDTGSLSRSGYYVIVDKPAVGATAASPGA